MNATVEIKGQKMKVTKFIKWENDHAKYEGCVYMTGIKGGEYMGFVLKGSDKVRIQSCGLFSSKDLGIGIVSGLVINPYPSVAEILKAAISEKFGISAQVAVSPEGVTMDVQTIQSASTLLRAFRRHKALIKANDYMNYTMFIPIELSGISGLLNP
jgi:hypothetical protein